VGRCPTDTGAIDSSPLRCVRAEQQAGHDPVGRIGEEKSPWRPGTPAPRAARHAPAQLRPLRRVPRVAASSGVNWTIIVRSDGIHRPHHSTHNRPPILAWALAAKVPVTEGTVSLKGGPHPSCRCTRVGGDHTGAIDGFWLAAPAVAGRVPARPYEKLRLFLGWFDPRPENDATHRPFTILRWSIGCGPGRLTWAAIRAGAAWGI